MTVNVVILIGPPGAGKGTQAVRLSAARGLIHVSTGDLFRDNLKRATPLGKQAQTFMDRGQLVPDAIVIEMLFDRVGRPDCAAGYLLDGFPRTVEQARALGERLAGARPIAVQMLVQDATIVERAAGRLTCKNCGNIQHLRFAPPRAPGLCDQCGGALQQRADDRPEVVGERLRVFHEQTAPVVEYYRALGLLRTVDGEQTPDQVFQSLLHVLPPKEAA